MVKVGSYLKARFTKRTIRVTEIVADNIVNAVTVRDEYGKLVTDKTEYPFSLEWFDEVEA